MGFLVGTDHFEGQYGRKCQIFKSRNPHETYISHLNVRPQYLWPPSGLAAHRDRCALIRGNGPTSWGGPKPPAALDREMD